jgi:histone H1/5
MGVLKFIDELLTGRRRRGRPMSSKKSKAKGKKLGRPKAAKPKAAVKVRPKAAARAKAAAKPKAAARTKAVPKAKAAPAGRPAPKGKPAAAGKAVSTGKPAVAAKAPLKPAAAAKPGAPGKAPSRKSSRRPTLLRRGPDGEILAPGDLLLPGGIQRAEEAQYLFRGCVAAEHSVGEEAVTEVVAKRATPETPGEREVLSNLLGWARERFERGTIEPVIPPRSNLRRSFQGVVERAKHRRREIGAFLRGLDIGHTETSHMDAHGEASLQSLMEWAARLENLAEADEPNQADYAQFHRGLDQLENTTEALIIDVEQTLRRLQDRLRA